MLDLQVFEEYKKFIRITEVAERVMNSGLDWETKYDLIFSENISRAQQALRVAFDYYDPDTSEEEDVRAYVEALKEKAEELKLKVADTDSGSLGELLREIDELKRS